MRMAKLGEDIEGDEGQENEWGGAEEVMQDPDEQRVLLAALDSF